MASTADHGAPVTPTAPPHPAKCAPTKRRHYTPRARRCAVCGETFTPKNKTARTCSTACRSKLYRQRLAAKRKRQPTPPRPALPATCAHCRRPFWATNRLQTHCSASCRTLASRARRQAAIDLLIYAGYTPLQAADAVELHGLASISAQLEAVGYAYDAETRSFRPALPASGNLPKESAA